MSTYMFILSCVAILSYGLIWHGSDLLRSIYRIPREFRRRRARYRRQGGFRALVVRLAHKMSR